MSLRGREAVSSPETLPIAWLQTAAWEDFSAYGLEMTCFGKCQQNPISNL
jgi:hypothetical protein